RVDAAAVDEDEQLVREVVAEAADRDRPLVRAVAGDLDAGRKPQRLGQARDAAAADLLGGDDVDRGRQGVQRLGAPRSGLHAYRAELLEAQVERARAARLRGGRRSHARA